MKILITGGAGFIGTNLAKRLLKEGHTVEVIDDYSTGYFEDNHIEKVHYVKTDINNISGKYDIIFHLAALSRIQPSFDNPDETFRVNVLGTQKVLELARKTNAKVVYAGSSSKWHDPHQSPYATTKWLGEEMCKMYRRTYNMDVEIARFYNVYGPNEIVGPKGGWAAVIGIWRYQSLNNQPLTIVGDGNQRRDFTHVDDIVDGLYKIGMNNIKHDDAWELGTGMNYSVLEVANMFVEKYGVKTIHLDDEPGNYRKTLRENDDTLKKFNWTPSDKLEQYINSL